MILGARVGFGVAVASAVGAGVAVSVGTVVGIAVATGVFVGDADFLIVTVTVPTFCVLFLYFPLTVILTVPIFFAVTTPVLETEAFSLEEEEKL